MLALAQHVSKIERVLLKTGLYRDVLHDTRFTKTYDLWHKEALRCTHSLRERLHLSDHLLALGRAEIGIAQIRCIGPKPRELAPVCGVRIQCREQGRRVVAELTGIGRQVVDLATQTRNLGRPGRFRRVELS